METMQSSELRKPEEYSNSWTQKKEIQVRIMTGGSELWHH